MRIYFLHNNLQELNNYFNDLYITTIDKFEEKLYTYRKNITLCELINDTKKITDLLILSNELNSTIEQLKNIKFKNFYIKWEIELLEKIRYASVSDHTDKCVARAIFDILFKYCIDYEYKISHVCCNNTRFKTLQFEILRDLRWKIRN